MVIFVLDVFLILSKMTVSGKICGQNLASNLSGSIWADKYGQFFYRTRQCLFYLFGSFFKHGYIIALHLGAFFNHVVGDEWNIFFCFFNANQVYSNILSFGFLKIPVLLSPCERSEQGGSKWARVVWNSY